MAISQNAILAKWQAPKSLLLLYLSETFRIDANMDIANNLVRGILIKASKKNLSRKSKDKMVNLGPNDF